MSILRETLYIGSIEAPLAARGAFYGLVLFEPVIVYAPRCLGLSM
jgi:hypothetical protein